MEELNGKLLLDKIKKALADLDNDTKSDYEHFDYTVMLVLKLVEALKDDALANLAAGYACMFNKFREEPQNTYDAIKYFEKYIELTDNSVDSNIYRYLADRYYEDCDFLKAAHYYELAQLAFDDYYYNYCLEYTYDINSKKVVPVDMRELRLKRQVPDYKAAKVYLKAGTQYAIDYWQRQKESEFYNISQLFKDSVDVELAKVIDQKNKGYVYKPQKRKKLLKKLLNLLYKVMITKTKL